MYAFCAGVAALSWGTMNSKLSSRCGKLDFALPFAFLYCIFEREITNLTFLWRARQWMAASQGGLELDYSTFRDQVFGWHDISSCCTARLRFSVLNGDFHAVLSFCLLKSIFAGIRRAAPSL
jgi:hypothetical protein